MSWVEEEVGGTELGDKRRTQRLVKLIEDIASAPNASIPQASRDNGAMQGIYEFWSNPRIDADAILSGHQQQTLKRIASHAVVLAIQDTSELDYSSQKHLSGVGPISNAEAQGLKMHTVLAASSSGIPLGILHQEVWARDKQRRTSKRRREIAEKESVRWLGGLEAAQSQIATETKVITIGDREADIYELFAHPRRDNSELLIRAAQNRKTQSSESGEVQPLFEAIASAPVIGEATIEMQRTPRRVARSARLVIRIAKLWLQAPAHLPTPGVIVVNVIEAAEATPPEGEKAIRWVLLTTLPVDSLEEAQ
ncbi:IS4 family transposase, partial [Phormidium tenue FACHB-886]|nr:IS4 family transposase [Phormidium tenue FACHB-886]